MKNGRLASTDRQTSGNRTEMKSCLVVFYSRSGMTRKIAGEIAQACGGDVEAIRETGIRAGPLGYFRSGFEALTKKLPAIKPTIKDPAKYRIVVLGTPVWASNISSPMRSYIMQNRNRFNEVAAFCTMGDSGGDKVLNEISELCSKPLSARLLLTDHQIAKREYREQITAFVKSFEKVN